jgi:hypothetical protein
VSNLDGLTNMATDGYVEFTRKELASSEFTITITKIGSFKKHFVHMTLVVTTSESAVRLDATTTHYEKYLPRSQKNFIMEYDPNEENIINIFTEGLEKRAGTMRVIILDAKEAEAGEGRLFVSREIRRDSEAINLNF